jgi:hypothetical protein
MGKYFIQLIKISILIFALPFEGLSQEEDKLGAWLIYNGSFYPDPKIELFFESQLRFYELMSNKQEFFLRPMINYHFSPLIFAGIGYSYGMTWTYEENKDDKIKEVEHRIILQTGLNHAINRTKIQHRYRFEQRWFETGNRQRFRYRIQVTVPVGKKSIEKGTVFINVYDELFVNSGPELAFDQNRLYMAGGYQFSKTLNLQIGYLFQSRPSNNFHRLQVFLTQKVNFFKQ